MGGDSKREFRDAIQPRYLEASREEKGFIFREFCAVCKYHRKYAIRFLNQRKRGPTKRPGRKPVYHSAEFLGALMRIWLATDQMCSKKLVAAIPLWLPFYEGTYGKLSVRTTNQLLSVSAATIDRLLAKTRAKTRLKGRSATKPGSLLRNQIPIRTHNWDISQPGFMEADTAANRYPTKNKQAGGFFSMKLKHYDNDGRAQFVTFWAGWPTRRTARKKKAARRLENARAEKSNPRVS